MNWLKSSRTWFAPLLSAGALLLNGCAKPPHGPVGIIGESRCFVTDYSRTQPEYSMSLEDCGKAGFIGTTARYDRILRQAYVDCITPASGPMCVLGPDKVICADPSESGPGNLCHGKEILNGTCDLTYREAINFVITTPDYFRILRAWYARRCG